MEIAASVVLAQQCRGPKYTSLLIGPLNTQYMTVFEQDPTDAALMIEAARIQRELEERVPEIKVMPLGRPGKLPHALVASTSDPDTLVKEFRDGQGALREVLGRAVLGRDATMVLYTTAPNSIITAASAGDVWRTVIANGSRARPPRWYESGKPVGNKASHQPTKRNRATAQ